MKDRILEYISDKTGTPDKDIAGWLADNLDSEEYDAFFEKVFNCAPEEDDPQGRRSTCALVCGIASSRARAGRWKKACLITATVAVAAVVAILFLIRPESPQQWTAEYASYGQTRIVTLPDNTRIWLHNDSKIVFPDHFNATRTIFADGELYAEVSADRKHPFIISTKAAKVRVYGTRFNLSSYEDGSKVCLTLLSGVVEMDVPAAGGERHFTLEPGDRIEVDRESGAVSQEHIDATSFNLWKDSRRFYFHDKPLKEIVPELEQGFGVRIIVKDSRVLSMRYLAAFVNGESLDAILDALNCDGALRIRKNGDTYYIYPNI